MKILTIIFIIITICACRQVEQENVVTNDSWKIGFDHTGIKHLSRVDDPFKANVLSGRLDTDVQFQMKEGEWQSIFKRLTTTYRPPEHEPTFARQLDVGDEMVQFTDYKSGMPFSMEQTFRLNDDVLEWDIVLENQMYYHVNIGDVAINFPLSYASAPTQEGLFEGGYTRRRFISGDGSFLLFTKRSGNPPYLLLTVKPGTKLEYFEESSYFIHSGYSGNQETRGTWRQDHTYSELEPKGEDNDKISYGFRLQWADSYDELRNILYENNLIDVRVVPGMTLPEDLEAKFSLRTKTSIDSIVAEYPDQTEIEYIGENKPDHHVYSVNFDRLGENMLTVHFDGNRKTYLEFFSTEPIKTLLEKRNSFIVENQQHRDPDLWYDGLFSIWDMKNSVLRGPDNTDGYDGWWGYMVACDDPVLGIAPYLASVNALFPDKEQIEAIEYNIENYVWGGLQRTDEEEPYPYGIHGVPNFKVARDTNKRAEIENRRLDRMKIWRTYDYPHVFMLYYHMFQIAERYPDKVSYLDADGYFERMVQTVRAFFEYPYEIYSWYDIYKWGHMNEMLIPEIIELIEKRGSQEDADWLRDEWEKKVKYFVYDDPYPYRSEYPTDRTAFETSYALAKYGATTEMEPADSVWYDKNEDKWYSYREVNREDALEFMERQHKANLAVRGWLPPKYFALGSDRCSNLSYMARMGGWSILDYGLQFSEDPHDWLQLGYASYLSSFALMNTGRPETEYGYWYPGEKNDGALGWAFQEEKHGREWIRQNEDRGAWRYDGEQNLGMGAVTRMASTIFTEDPLFGRIAYGGQFEETDEVYKIWPRDGVRIRFWLIDDNQRLGVELERDGFSRDKPILVSKNCNRIEFTIENRTNTSHQTKLILDGNKLDEWKLSLDDENIQPEIKNERIIFSLDIINSEHQILLER